MNCEIKGRITADLGKRTGVKDGKDWEYHEYIVTEMFQYGKNMKFSIFSSDGPISTPLSIGDDVTVKFNVVAREHQGKWYNDVRAWSVQVTGHQQ